MNRRVHGDLSGSANLTGLGHLLLVLTLLLSGCIGVREVMSTPEPPTAAPPTAAPTQPPAPAATTAPTPAPTNAEVNGSDINAVIDWEMRGSFNFFWEQANTDPSTPGFGLILDRWPGDDNSRLVSSIASVGFGLTAIPIGVEHGWITREQGLERASKTLDTLLKMERVEGFYYHFVSMQTGERAWKSEVSNIDTSILLMGVLFAGEYFGGDVQAKADKIYGAVNWPWYYDASKKAFWMGYNLEQNKGFYGHWDFYAEQLMLYVLAAGSPTHPVGSEPYYAFTRRIGKYDDVDGTTRQFINSWFGSIFTYQFSHAWIDFKPYVDKLGTNWFDNSVEASKSQVAFATYWGNNKKSATISGDAWGLTACDGPKGYDGRYGAPPAGNGGVAPNIIDGTVPPCGAIGSIIFLPEDAKRAMLHYYGIEKLRGKYGFIDAYNLDQNWYGPDVIGLDKGISLLMLANYQDGFVHKVMMKNKHIQAGLAALELTKR